MRVDCLILFFRSSNSNLEPIVIMPIKKFVFFCLFLLPISCAAQLGKGFNISPTLHIGRVLKHTPKLNFNVDDISYGFELNLTHQKKGSKAWHKNLNYPIIGIDVFYYHIGSKEVFGDAVGIFPNITIPMFVEKRLGAAVQLGSGIAYLSQHFDPISNTANNAIGSNLNNITAFKAFLTYRVNHKLRFDSGFSFTHFSNGASQLPNFGINILAYSVGIQYTPQPTDRRAFIANESTTPFQRKWGMNVHLDMAFREHLVSGGPRYPVYIASLGLTYLTSPTNRWTLGFEYEFNKSIYVFGLHTFQFDSKKEARQQSSRWAVFLGDEILFGNVGVYGQVGVYLPTKAWLLPFSFYTKLGLRYYLPALGRPKTKFYAGIYIKSHKITAEHFSFGFGANF